MQRLQASYIDRKNDLSENDVRHQYDNMMIAVNDVVTAGGVKPDELLLIAMFENALPLSYSVIKQMTRRVVHKAKTEKSFLNYIDSLDISKLIVCWVIGCSSLAALALEGLARRAAKTADARRRVHPFRRSVTRCRGSGG